MGNATSPSPEFLEWASDFCNRLGHPPTPWDAWRESAAPATPKPLTEEQIVKIIEHADGSEFSDIEFARAIEAAHGIGAATKESDRG